MKKRISVLVTLMIITILGIIIILNNINKPYEIKNTNNGQFAFFYEDENGEYQRSRDSKWNTGEYILNLESSTCDGENNPSFLSWNNDNNSVILTRNKATKCLLYFDIKTFDRACDDNSLACYIAKKQGTSVGDNNEELIYHNGLIDVDGNGTYDDAGDLSYRYSGDNPNNFVCFGTNQSPCPVQNLYRIIGVFPVSKEDGSVEYQVKLIKSEYITQEELGINRFGTTAVSYERFGITPRVSKTENIDLFTWWNDKIINNWTESPLYEALNNEENGYLSNFSDKWKNMITNNTWFLGGIGNEFSSIVKVFYDHELGKDRVKENEVKCVDAEGNLTACTKDLLETQAKIGLMYASDYIYTSDRNNWSLTPNTQYSESRNLNANWLYNALYEFTITRYNVSTDLVGHIDLYGYLAHFSRNNVGLQTARPVFYLNADVPYVSGKGTSDDPYQIVEKATDLSGNNYNGEFIGNLQIQKDDEGNYGLYFDGNESYVDIADLPETINWTDGFSYEFEIKYITFKSWVRIFDFGNGAPLDNILFANTDINDNNFYPSTIYYNTNVYQNQKTFNLEANKRYKIKVEYKKTNDGYTEIIYLNDIKQREISYNGQIVRNVRRSNNYLGKTNWNDPYFNGYIYNIKFTDSNGKPILWYDFSR